MILEYSNKMKEKITRDGSVLKHIRSIGGGSAGAMAGGIVLLIFGVLLGGLCLAVGLLAVAAAIGVILVLPGLILYIIGSSARRRRLANYLDYYRKETGYSDQELAAVERELQDPTTILYGYVPEGTSKKNRRVGVFLTRNYFVVPEVLGTCYIKRIPEIAAAAYSERIPGVNGYRSGLVYVASGERETRHNSLLPKDSCMEIIAELSRRNPAVITAQRFLYEGEQYDLLSDGEKVARLYEKHVER